MVTKYFSFLINSLASDEPTVKQVGFYSSQSAPFYIMGQNKNKKSTNKQNQTKVCSLSDLQLKGKLSLDYVETPPLAYRNVLTCLSETPKEPTLLRGWFNQIPRTISKQAGLVWMKSVKSRGLLTSTSEMESLLIWAKESFQLNSVSFIFLDYLKIYS